jgi:hypothetical protein
VTRVCSFWSVTRITFGLMPHATATREIITAGERFDPPVTARHIGSLPREFMLNRPTFRQELDAHVPTWASRNDWICAADIASPS